MKRPGVGTISLTLSAGGWLLSALAIVLGGLDPGPESVMFMVLGYLGAISGTLLGIIGLVKREQVKRSGAATLIGLGWILVLIGAPGLLAPR